MTAIPLWVIAAVATIWFLRAATTLLVPVAIAVCVSYALEPVVAWMARVMPRLAAASLVMLVLVAGAGFGLYSLRDQAVEAVEALPRATERLRQMVAGGGSGPAAQIKEATRDLQGLADGGQQKSGSGAGSTAPGGTSRLVWLGASSAVAFAGNLVTVLFLVYFLLAAGDHFARRIVEISGTAERRRMAARIMRDINSQVQRFLLVRAFTGVIVALATWGALAWLQTPQAPVWAVFAGVFNSIPYFGPVIVSGGLFVVGLVQGDFRSALAMSGAALVITSLEGWLLTPPLLGKAERMSATVIFLGLLFWTWIWGAWGTLLAVPMLVVLKAVTDHVDRLKPVSRLLAP